MNRQSSERGIAIIMTLILILIISVMAVSLTFVSRSETWSSLNYRLMSQARDGAEAGVNRVANYLLYSYTSPSSTGADDIDNYDVTVSPVAHDGDAVVLSGDSDVPDNYPVSSVQDAFNSATHGALTAGNTTLGYKASARLISMQEIDKYGGGKATVQTWEITSTGSVSGVQGATVTVTAKLEQQVTPVFTYAAFATFNGCDALNFGGGGSTSSYDSQAALGGGGTPVITTSDGNVGTNGSLSTFGNPTTIYGSLSTPRIGVGNCSEDAITAWDSNNGTVTGGMVQLPQAITYPTPDAPDPLPPTDSYTLNAGPCPGGLTGCSSGSSGVYTLSPGGYGNITVNGGATLNLTAGTYRINSLTLAGNSQLKILSGPVILEIAGVGQTTPLDLTGGSLTNTTGYDAETFQVLYAGTGNIKLRGGAYASGLLYAPNASFSFSGGSHWYGAVIGKYMTDMGGTAIHYDRRLKTKLKTAGPYTLDSFNWKKY